MNKGSSFHWTISGMLHSGSIIKTGYQTDMLHGRILTPDGLRVLCASLDNDPEKIGKHMLEMLAKFRSEGLFNVVVEDETDDDPGNGE